MNPDYCENPDYCIYDDERWPLWDELTYAVSNAIGRGFYVDLDNDYNVWIVDYDSRRSYKLCSIDTTESAAVLAARCVAHFMAEHRSVQTNDPMVVAPCHFCGKSDLDLEGVNPYRVACYTDGCGAKGPWGFETPEDAEIETDDAAARIDAWHRWEARTKRPS